MLQTMKCVKMVERAEVFRTSHLDCGLLEDRNHADLDCGLLEDRNHAVSELICLVLRHTVFVG